MRDDAVRGAVCSDDGFQHVAVFQRVAASRPARSWVGAAVTKSVVRDNGKTGVEQRLDEAAELGAAAAPAVDQVDDLFVVSPPVSVHGRSTDSEFKWRVAGRNVALAPSRRWDREPDPIYPSSAQSGGNPFENPDGYSRGTNDRTFDTALRHRFDLLRA
jgi:hypothetical protein